MRILRVILGSLCVAFGLVWGVAMSPKEADRLVLGPISRKLEFGGEIEPEALARLLERARVAVARGCSSAVFHSAAVLELRAIDSERVDGVVASEADIEAARAATVRALACDPWDSVHWVTLALVRSQGHAPDDEVRALLRASLATGRDEGVAMVRRVQVMPSLANVLDAELRDRFLTEFAIVASNLTVWQWAILAFADSTGAGRAFATEALDRMRPTERARFQVAVANVLRRVLQGETEALMKRARK